MASTDTILSSKASIIGSNGQITVPDEVLQHLGLKDGDRVDIAIEGNGIRIRPAMPLENPFDKWVGALPAFNSIAEINAWIADMRDGDEGPEEDTGE